MGLAGARALERRPEGRKQLGRSVDFLAGRGMGGRGLGGILHILFFCSGFRQLPEEECHPEFCNSLLNMYTPCSGVAEVTKDVLHHPALPSM